MISALLWTATYFGDALDVLELDTVDARFVVRPDRPVDDVAVVAVDDVTLSDLNERWPFRRSLHARVIDELRRAGAKVIAYDVQFTEPSQINEAAGRPFGADQRRRGQRTRRVRR